MVNNTLLDAVGFIIIAFFLVGIPVLFPIYAAWVAVVQGTDIMPVDTGEVVPAPTTHVPAPRPPELPKAA